MRIQSLGLFLIAVATSVSGAHAAGVPGQGTWETTLLGRDANGYAVAGKSAEAEFLYDTSLNITWLRDANANGLMTWGNINNPGTVIYWIKSLVVSGYGEWRLPTMVDTGALGCDGSYSGGTDCGFNVQTATSEMAHLFYVALGNKAFCSPNPALPVECAGSGYEGQSGWGLKNTGAFKNLQGTASAAYWTGTEYALNSNSQWEFSMYNGNQDVIGKYSGLYGMAVRQGDVLTVPEPHSSATLLAGLACLGMMLRRRRQG